MINMETYFRHDNPREEQQKLMDKMQTAVTEKKHLVANAPTGLGKTDASISVCMSYAIQNNKKVIFLTPKTAQHQMAIDVARGIKEKHNIDITAVDFVGRNNMCSNPFMQDMQSGDFYRICESHRKNDSCQNLSVMKDKGTMTAETKNFSEQLLDQHNRVVSNSQIMEFCKNNKINGKSPCAYEIASILCRKANLIICDFLQIFSPSIKGTFLSKHNLNLEDCIIIVDEAHNLPDRIRDFLSTSINNFLLKKAKEELTEIEWDSEEATVLINSLNDLASKNLQKCDSARVEFSELGLSAEDAKNYAELFDSAGEAFSEKTNKEFAALFKTASFLNSWVEKSNSFVRVVSRKNFGAALSVKCLDPSISSSKVIDKSHSTIMMSGTLYPPKMYSDILGVRKDRAILASFDSPFPKNNRIDLIVRSVSTSFSKRTPSQFERIASRIAMVVSKTPGNCAVFFPSHNYLRMVLPFMEEKISKQLFVQEEAMKPKDVKNTLTAFKNAGMGFGGVLVGVQGGSFAEGIDLPGTSLLSVMIVGVALSVPSIEIKALIEYYEEKFGQGQNYGYNYPAIQRAVQAAGRCIRSETDKGVIVFMDERFDWSKFRECMPKDIKLESIGMGEPIEEFWKN